MTTILREIHKIIEIYSLKDPCLLFAQWGLDNCIYIYIFLSLDGMLLHHMNKKVLFWNFPTQWLHGDIISNAVATQPETRFNSHLRSYLRGVCTFSSRPYGFPLDAAVSSQMSKMLG